MDEERINFWLWQTEYIRSHKWHRYSVTASQIKVANVNYFRSDEFNLTTKNH